MESLRNLLYTKLDWHPARVLTFYDLIIGIIVTGSVTIKDLGVNVTSKGKIKARIAKIERLLKYQIFDYKIIACIILGLFASANKYTIVIDRTNWKFGNKNINFLVAGIVSGNMSIPIYWIMLDKKGNSNTNERIILFENLFKIISLDKIDLILADREFMGGEWLNYLYSRGIPFAIRIKKSEQIRHHNGGKIKIEKYFSGKEGAHSKTVKFYGLELKLTYLKLTNDELFIISNVIIGDEALQAYKQRWTIERTFKALKTSGFNIEDTHITDQDKLAKLFALASIAMAICIISGKIKNQLIQIKNKNHGRRTFSLFTYGIDWLRDYLSSKKIPELSYLSLSLDYHIIQLVI